MVKNTQNKQEFQRKEKALDFADIMQKGIKRGGGGVSEDTQNV